MSTPAIRVENLGKRYRIGLREEAKQNFREVLMGLAAAPLRRLRGLREHTDGDDTFWALKDVSFEVQPGEVVGIIGRNGAGKTTLLKILSRITEPTQGRVELRGRVASLLEVGTGFHPELTGRENIYLNGAILGMKKAEIDRNFDEIVAFAETEKFLDTPVKRYSSGMYVRLAFAVAAHLEPDILIVDEVLAVGDAAFQKKCLGKMKDVAKGGRTVLFVSHNTSAVEVLCSSAILIEKGLIRSQGKTQSVIRRYLQETHSECATLKGTRPGEYDLRGAPRGGVEHECTDRLFEFLTIRDDKGHVTDVVRAGQAVTFELQYRFRRELINPKMGIIISRPGVGRIAFLQTLIQHGPIEVLPSYGKLQCHLPHLPLVPGTYVLTLGASIPGEQLDWIEHCIEFEVQPADCYGTGHLPPITHGFLLLQAHWELPEVLARDSV